MFLVPIICGCAFFTESRYRYFYPQIALHFVPLNPQLPIFHLSGERVQPIFYKDSANEGNESLLSNCRVQPILCKDSANKSNES
ncbi:MAG: hypothetical protein E7D78_02720, partial [Prevotella bivia]|nr:hypothetical protein [Prevotella bivia]